MKLQALFSSKNKSKEIKVPFAAIFVWRFKGKYQSVVRKILIQFTPEARACLDCKKYK